MTYTPLPPNGGPPWSNPHSSSPPQSNVGRSHWIVIGVSLFAIVALVVGIVVWKSGLFSSSTKPSLTADGGGDRAIGLLRKEDPVCEDWLNYADELAAGTKEWSEIDKAIPATAWTPQQQAMVDGAVSAISTAADRFESILPNAQSAVLRELIAQTIVYWRAYLAKVPDYVESDSLISGVAGNFGGAVTYMCSAVALLATTDGAGAERAAKASYPGQLEPFMASADGNCKELLEAARRREAILRAWADGDPTVPSSQWNAEERRLNTAAREVLLRDAAKLRELAESGGNGVFSDLIYTQAEYMRTYADAIPTYSPDDDVLWKTTIYIGGGLSAACRAHL